MELPEEFYIGFTPEKNGYKIMRCMQGPDGPYCETVATTERQKRGTVEFSATGGLRRALPGMDAGDVTDEGALSRCLLRILHVGNMYLRDCASESTLYERIEKEMNTLVRASERITEKINEEPEDVQRYLGPMLGDFNRKVFGAITGQAQSYPTDVRENVMEMLGFGAKELEPDQEDVA
ncbi:MAG: hypothetical protein KAH93_02420 [Candidatus Aenigmarchaeota archaeon]|nr:hypothetical protein [Candidatus Aenigmarchaeota archaeon]